MLLLVEGASVDDDSRDVDDSTLDVLVALGVGVGPISSSVIEAFPQPRLGALHGPSPSPYTLLRLYLGAPLMVVSAMSPPQRLQMEILT